MAVVVSSGRVIETRADLFVLRHGPQEITVSVKPYMGEIGLGMMVEVYDDGTYTIAGEPPPEPQKIPVTREGADKLQGKGKANG